MAGGKGKLKVGMELKIAIRNLLKRPFLNLIKIIGLSLALSGILIISLFLKNEMTYDRFHKKSVRIYRFTITSPEMLEGKHFARIPNPDYIPSMAEYFPEIENYVRLVPIVGGVLKLDENFVRVNEGFQCDSTFFDVFDAELLVGNSANILDNPGSMVVSESFAKKVFGNRNPVGQTLTLPDGQYYGKKFDFTIKGIMKDFPQNSHFHPEFIVTPVDKGEFNRWAWTYLLLADNANPENIVSRFKGFFAIQSGTKVADVKTEAHLQNIRDIHLHSYKLREIEPNSNMSVIYTLSIAILLLLFIAITNYVNLNIGMAVFSDKYFYVSRVFGSSRMMKMKYLLAEGIVITLVSIFLCGIIVSFAHISIQKHFSLNLFSGNTPLALLIILLFTLISILSGILMMLKQETGSFKPGLNQYKINSRRKGVSKSLIVLQYTISIALIIAVLVIQRQTNYALDSSMGVRENNLICFEDLHTNVQQKFELFKAELLKYNSIEFVSAMFEPPGGEANDMFQFTMEGYNRNDIKEQDDRIGIFPCDYSFASIFNLKFIGGNNFSENNQDNDGSGEYIINESAMRRLNYTDPDKIIGKEFGLIFDDAAVKIPKGKIIGVVKDFHLSSIKKKIEPLVLFKRKDIWLINFVVSFRPGMRSTALPQIEHVWKKMFPEHLFQYEYVSSMYKNLYKTELLQSRLLSVFTLIALFICSMGLLGMSLLTTQRRTSEIGIRKVNGATIGEIMVMLNWNFIKWIMLSIIIAIPLAYFAMTKWLAGFAYKTSLEWWIFALAGLIAIFIALITVSIQSWKAASRNPVEALRYE
jgi:putative ABC transport system permease protein